MEKEEKLVLLHSNDMHGDFLAETKGSKQVGGVSLLSGYIKKTRAENPNTLFAIAGDMFRGSIIDSEYLGLSTIDLMNMLSPDVMAVGNHEVDVKGLVGVGAYPFDNGSAEGEVRHKVAVHHVEVHPVGACLVHAFYFLSHPREVAREE